MTAAMGMPLVSAADSAALDKEAVRSWGLNPFALVEAAGRSCAAALEARLPRPEGPVLAMAGSGNNGADALVMLRALVLSGFVPAERAAAVVSRGAGEETTPRSEALKALTAMGIPVRLYGNTGAEELIAAAELIIDGIAGTGLKDSLRGVSLDMVHALNARRSACTKGRGRPVVAAIDLPSGGGDTWKPGYPQVEADLTLAIEPLKQCLYVPAQRPRCGAIVFVEGIFPQALISDYSGGAELLDWPAAAARIAAIPPDSYKFRRGVAEIRAGSEGFAGAARIAAAGASAAGAGLVRLVVDSALYPVLAASSGGVMVAPDTTDDGGRFIPDALLLGPGWGRSEHRRAVLGHALEAEARGLPLILDADGIALAKDAGPFHGSVILTPHAGELEYFSGIPREELLADPSRIAWIAAEKKAVILFKSHVMIAAAPPVDGKSRLAFVDGMTPLLAAGGSGDLLAGFCAALAARAHVGRAAAPDLFAAAAAAAALLVAAARSRGPVFTDPLDLALPAAALAGKAWLSGEGGPHG